MRAALHTLRDGTTVLLRPQEPHDRALLADLFGRVSPTTRYLRFATGMPPQLPPRVLHALAAVGRDHFGVLALHGGELVGAARYIRSAREHAEADVALTVLDAFQGRGLGGALFATLAEHAVARCVERFTFDMLAVNRSAAALAHSFGAQLQTSGSDVQGVVALAAARTRRAA